MISGNTSTLQQRPLAHTFWCHCLLVAGFCLIQLSPLKSQVVDVNTPKSGWWNAVGNDSADFVAQSFVAGIRQLRKIGVWLKKEVPPGEVRIAIMSDDGSNRPNLNFVLHESTIIAPSDSGQYIDSSFTAVLSLGQKYWIVVDGFNNLGTAGYSAVGISDSLTNTGSPFRYSTDGGATWPSVPGKTLAIYAEGSNCQFPLTIFPTYPTVCPGDQVFISVPSGHLVYSWSNGGTGSGTWVSQPGMYSVTVVDANMCISVASITVNGGIQPNPQFPDTITMCEGSSVTLSANPFFNAYLWSTGSTLSVDTFYTAGTYWVHITSSAGCVGRDTFEIFTFPRPIVDLGNDTSICEGQFIVIDAGPDFQQYSWSSGATTSTVYVDATQTLWVQVVDTNNCLATSDTVAVSVFPNPSVPVITQTSSGLSTDFAFGYQWLLNGVPIPNMVSQYLLSPAPGIYSVLVSNVYGCKTESDTVHVVDIPVGDFISQGFSPNGDGLNEYFFVEGISRYPENSLVVFNRWGDEVFRIKGYQNDWHGLGPGGKPLADGNYFYVLDLGNGKAPLRGVVLINR
jgi:gliding motility-associated-like protein